MSLLVRPMNVYCERLARLRILSPCLEHPCVMAQAVTAQQITLSLPYKPTQAPLDQAFPVAVQQKPDCPLSDAQEQEALTIILASLRLKDRNSLTSVEPGPAHIGDKDLALSQGSSEGCASP